MNIKYLKNEYEDGLVFFQIKSVVDPQDEYIYEALELIMEDNNWEADLYELTEADLDEMYEDGFENIDKEEFESAVAKSGLDLSELEQ